MSVPFYSRYETVNKIGPLWISRAQLGMYLYFHSPSTWRIFMVEGLVDDAHHRLTRAPQVNPDEDQRAVKTWGKEVALLQYLLSALYVLAGGIWMKSRRERGLSPRLSFIVLWTWVGLRNVATDKRDIRPFTYGVDPNAELGGIKGHHEAVCVGVDGRRVLVDGTSQQRSCRVVTVQHCRQQHCGLLLCAADSDRHTLSYRRTQWSTIVTQSTSVLFFKCQPFSQRFERRLSSLEYLSLKIIGGCSLVMRVILFVYFFFVRIFIGLLLIKWKLRDQLRHLERNTLTAAVEVFCGRRQQHE